MAQPTTNEQLTVTDFGEIRPWTTFPIGFQNAPSTYRQPRYRTDPDNNPAWLDLFERTIYQRDQNTGELRPEFCLARLISEALGRVKYLERMADNRNAILNEAPSKDARNFTNTPMLRMAWHLHSLVAALYADGLYRLQVPRSLMTRFNWWEWVDTERYMLLWRQFIDIQHLERLERTRLRSGFGTLPNEFLWVRSFERSLHEAYDALAAAWTWSQTLEGRNLNLVLSIASQDIPEMTRMLAILLERQKSFEDILSQEHLFGCLFDKRIKLFSSWDLCFLWDKFVCTDPEDAMRNYSVVYQHLDGPYRDMSHYQQRINELFYYKYLMDWNWNKMWDRLYVVINPKLDISDQTIDKFVNWSTSNGTIAQNVFAVHPIKRSQLQGESCAICMDDYLEDNHPIGVVVLKTKCGHYFHPHCIFQGWDTFSYWQNRCPYCRQSAGRLRDAIPVPNWSHLQTDREHETPGVQQMDDVYFDTVVDDYNNRRTMGTYNKEVRDVFWWRALHQYRLNPARLRREANRPSWQSILGGG